MRNNFFQFVFSSLQQLIPTFSKLWADLGESEKEKYVLQYKKKFEKYKRDLLKWEETLISEGKLERVEAKSSQRSSPSISRSRDKK